jgi:ABC-type lipoprotein release transport system permease subunit
MSDDLEERNNTYHRKRPLWTAAQAPAFTMKERSGQFGSGSESTFLMSLPSYNRLYDPRVSLNDTKWERLFIKFKDQNDEEVVKNFIDEVKGLPNNVRVFNYFDGNETMEQISTILDVIFSVIIAVTMFLCFFSLCSSMSANLLDQTKELGVLRAMGYSKSRI